MLESQTLWTRMVLSRLSVWEFVPKEEDNPKHIEVFRQDIERIISTAGEEALIRGRPEATFMALAQRQREKARKA